MRGLLEALELGEGLLLQKAYATFVMVAAGHLPNPLVEPALDLCRAATERLSDPQAYALLHMAIAEVEHFRGRCPQAERACERAERILLESCVGVSRELGQVRSVALLIQYAHRGDYCTNAEKALQWLSDADQRGDVYHGNWLRAAHSLAWMAQDEPARARAEIARAEQLWPGALGGTFETACVLFLDALDRYEDRPNVQARPAQGRASVLDSPVANTSLLQGYVHLQRIWGSLRELAAVLRHDARSGESSRRAAAEGIAQLRLLGLPMWAATADALDANLVLLAGQRARAEVLLEGAHASFAELRMLALGACARRRHGEVVGGELGARWVSEADTELVRLGVAAPARFARTYWSPFEVPS
jgi:hypothetical protein